MNPHHLVVLDEIIFVDNVSAFDIAPKSGTIVVVDMIPAECDLIAYRNLGATCLPLWIEPPDVVRPNAVVLDANISAVAIDTDLTIMMNVAAMHASVGPDADPDSAVQLH